LSHSGDIVEQQGGLGALFFPLHPGPDRFPYLLCGFKGFKDRLGRIIKGKDVILRGLFQKKYRL